MSQSDNKYVADVNEDAKGVLKFTPKKRNDANNYIDKKKFSLAVAEYVTICNECKESETDLPIVPDYIAHGFLMIGEGLSHKPSYSGYPYREELVMDAVENCLKAIKNYKLDAKTRSGKPNAFGYFTQISIYAFWRRIAKENKQIDIKIKFQSSASAEHFIVNETGGEGSHIVANNFVDMLKGRTDKIKDYDTEVEKYAKHEKQQPSNKKSRAATAATGDSDLQEFLE